MPDKPLISVLMPVHNAGQYLAHAIESILSQTCGDFEFIIFDDGSTDRSTAVISDYARRDQRIVVISHSQPQGIAKSMNEGLALARGRFIARMDGDDVSLPARFEKQATFLSENAEHVLVGCQCLLIDPQGRPICLKRDLHQSHEKIDTSLLAMGWPLVHPAVMMRADALAKIGGYDQQYKTNQDHDLFLRLAEVGRLANLLEVLFHYRQHFNSVVFTKVEAQTKVVLEISRAAYRRRGLAIPQQLQPKKPEPILPVEHRRNWAWWALGAGNVATARHHALAVLRQRPFSGESWKAMFCAIRGR